MKSYSFIDKVALCLLMIFSIVIIFADIFHYQIIQKNKIILENKIRYQQLNSNFLLKTSKNIIFNFRSAFNNIELNHELLNENSDLKNKINFLEKKNTELKMKSSFIESHQDIYQNYIISSAKIIGNVKTKDFMIIIDGPSSHIKINDFIINSCGILGKITYVGNNSALVMSIYNKKFNLPVSLGGTNNKILGIYSGLTNQISEINDKSGIFKDMDVFSMGQANKIPCCILIGQINNIENNRISVDPNFCETDLALILSYQK